MVSAVKVNNNIIMCKQYYIQSLFEEFGVFSHKASKTFSHDNISELLNYI